MPTPVCTQCRRVIPSTEINVAADLACCRSCNVSYRLSQLTYDLEVTGHLDLQNPPKGAWYKTEGSRIVIGARTGRSPGTTIMIVCFTLFWNGLVSVFVVLAIAGTLYNLHLPLPAWFPSPKLNGGDMSPGMTLFLWLFLTPFIAFGLVFALDSLMSLFGHTEVRLENGQGNIFTGIRSLGWKRSFDAADVKEVRLVGRRNNQGSHDVSILIETRAGKPLKLGSQLTNPRRLFILGALRQTLLK